MNLSFTAKYAKLAKVEKKGQAGLHRPGWHCSSHQKSLFFSPHYVCPPPPLPSSLSVVRGFVHWCPGQPAAEPRWTEWSSVGAREAARPASFFFWIRVQLAALKPTLLFAASVTRERGERTFFGWGFFCSITNSLSSISSATFVKCNNSPHVSELPVRRWQPPPPLSSSLSPPYPSSRSRSRSRDRDFYFLFFLKRGRAEQSHGRHGAEDERGDLSVEEERRKLSLFFQSHLLYLFKSSVCNTVWSIKG